MTRARRELISLDETPYYHCINRCVRRAFLCGIDKPSGKNYDHRKPLIIERIKSLTNAFSIDVCAYAIMSNHYHLVLKVNRQQSQQWTSHEVVERWRMLFKSGALVDRWYNLEPLGAAEHALVKAQIEIWRTRLYDIAWFMRCLNEHVARLANAEDHCSGRFWEGRYKSVALLNEAALLTCLAYVDLNPIRAGMCNTPEASDYTSIQARIKCMQESSSRDKNSEPAQPRTLTPFATGIQPLDYELPIQLSNYLELVDWSGRAIIEGKTGNIPNHLSHILDRIGIQQENWLDGMQTIEQDFFRAIGPVDKLAAFCQAVKQRWLQGTSKSRRLFKCAPA